MAFKFVIISCLLALVRGGNIPAAVVAQPVVAPAVAARLEEFDTFPQYTFGYNVADSITGDFKSQQESRNGDLVQGRYTLLEADGSTRVVDYTADSVNGFNAVVSKDPVIATASVVAAQPARIAAAPVVAAARYTVATPVAAPVAAPVATPALAPARYTAAFPAPLARYAAYPAPFARLAYPAPSAPIVAV